LQPGVNRWKKERKYFYHRVIYIRFRLRLIGKCRSQLAVMYESANTVLFSSNNT
jgi:hypothetical protein